MLTRSQIERRIRAFLTAQMPGLEREIAEMTPSVRIWDVIGSLSLLELVDYIEQAFGVDVAPLEFVPKNFRSIERIAVFVEARMRS